jgi:hypothetical protein
VTLVQACTFAEFVEILKEVAGLTATEKRLWDFSQIDATLSSPQIEMLAELSRCSFPGPGMIAIVAGNSLIFGLGRMFEAYRDDGTGTKVRVFRDMAEATRWLVDS